MGESRKVVICRLQTEEAKKLKEKVVFNRTEKLPTAHPEHTGSDHQGAVLCWFIQ